MEKLTWFENLQKSVRVTAPKPTDRVSEFADLFKTDAVDGPVTAQKMTKVHDDGAADGGGDFVKGLSDDRLHIPAFQKPQDGEFFEKTPSGVWRTVYKNGQVQRVTLMEDEDLCARDIFVPEGYVEKAIGTILGVSEEAMSGEDPMDALPKKPPMAVRNPFPSGNPMDDFEELLGGGHSEPEPSKKAASTVLAKGEIARRMADLLQNVRDVATSEEFAGLEKAYNAMDAALFHQLISSVVTRLKNKAA